MRDRRRDQSAPRLVPPAAAPTHRLERRLRGSNSPADMVVATRRAATARLGAASLAGAEGRARQLQVEAIAKEGARRGGESKLRFVRFAGGR